MKSKSDSLVLLDSLGSLELMVGTEQNVLIGVWGEDASFCCCCCFGWDSAVDFDFTVKLTLDRTVNTKKLVKFFPLQKRKSIKGYHLLVN